MHSLPANLLEQVLRRLTLLSLLRVCVVCRQWHNLDTASPMLRNRIDGVPTEDRIERLLSGGCSRRDLQMGELTVL